MTRRALTSPMNRNCIMLIRHAEKPLCGESAVGQDGWLDAHSLSVIGWRRAHALVSFFALASDHAIQHIARPRFIFAAPASHEHPTNRPLDTVRPTAQALQLAVETSWSDNGEPQRTAAHLQSLAGSVLVCWRHHSLPALGHALADALPCRDSEVPGIWPDDRYDIVWSFEMMKTGWSFTQVPQMLLPDDQRKPIGR